MNAEDNSNMTSTLIEGWFGSHHNIARSKENQPGIASGMLFELDFLTPVEAAGIARACGKPGGEEKNSWKKG
jgi:hypothetical protein